MSLSPEEQENIRNRIRKDLESSQQRGRSPSDPRQVMHYSQEETYLQKVEHIRREVEDDYFSQQPDYVQYINRYGVTKWVLEEELHQKRVKSRIRQENKRRVYLSQVRRFLLYMLAILITFTGYRAYIHFNVPPVILLTSNVEKNAMVFINTSLSRLRPNQYNRLEAGIYSIGIAAPGYRTVFKVVTMKKRDTTVVDFALTRDSLYNPDFSGVWRQNMPPARPDEPVTLTQLRTATSPKSAVQASKPVEVSSSASASTGNGGVYITSNQPDATVYLNNAPTPLPQNTLLMELPIGQLTFEVRKPGYRSNPAFLTTYRTEHSEKISLAFELVPEHTAKVTIKTEPIMGEIKLDGVAVGRGSIDQEPAVGSHTISFGDVPGFATPTSQSIDISERSGEQTIVGKYRPTVDFELRVDESGRIKSHGILNIQTGYWIEDKGAAPSQEFGPEVVKIKPYDFYVYQFGPGRPSANPSGSDYLEVSFNLPTGFDSDRPISLIVEGYATNRNFQFNLSKLTEIAIEVNGQVSQNNIRPSVNIDETRSVARDAFPISRFLKPGANRVMIRLTENSKCYYLLRGMKIE